MRPNRSNRLLILVASLLLALVPASALAAEPRSGDSIVVGPDETINDDLYAGGGNVDIRGTINGDVIAAGGNISVSGTVTGDLLLAGGAINVSGQVGQSVRAAGGNISINGAVGEDVVLTGGNLVVGSSGSVGRDFLAGGGSAAVDGEVGRNILGGLGNLTIAAPVGGDIRVDVGELRLTDKAVVSGDLVYTSANPAEIAQGAQVKGSVNRLEPEPRERVPEFPPGSGNPAIAWLRGLIGTFALGTFFVLMWPGFSGRAFSTLHRSPWASLGIGCALSLAIPVVAVVLFIVGLFAGGWWLGFLALAAYALLIALGFSIAGLSLGRWGFDRAGRGGVHPVWALLLGLAVLLLVGLAPYVGGLIVGVAVLFGLGALAIALVQSRREPPTPAVAEGPENDRAEEV